MNKAVEESRMVVQQAKLPPDLVAGKLVRSMYNTVITLDDFFNENGYVVANVAELANLSGRIESFNRITDKSGRCFYEAIFKKNQK